MTEAVGHVSSVLVVHSCAPEDVPFLSPAVSVLISDGDSQAYVGTVDSVV